MDRLGVEGRKGENAGDSRWRRVTARKEGDICEGRQVCAITGDISQNFKYKYKSTYLLI